MEIDKKNNIILPKTEFSIKRKNDVDQEILLEWEKKEIYKRNLLLNKEGNFFIIHDGPPYSNGPMHTGHFVNRVLKDFLLRFYSSIGFKTPFTIGWDTHGLPIEFKVVKEWKSKNLSKREIRNKCREYALSQIELQKSQLERIGLLTDYNYYSTQDFKYQAKELRILSEIAKKNFLYRGFKPVYWSWSNETALAENEVEYLEKEDYSLFFEINLSGVFFNYSNVNLVVWTTQPWTIPFNEIIAVNKNENYCLIEIKEKFLIISEKFTENIHNLKKENFSSIKILKIFKGKEILGKKYFKLFSEKEKETSYIIDGENYVNVNEGTGILHIAPSCGPDDFDFAKKENIKVEPFLDEKGKIKERFFLKDISGLFYQDVNEWILDDLSKKNHIFNCQKFIHSYPHDWRDKTPLVYRLTEQWFIKLSDLKEKIKKNIEKVYWLPEHSKEKMISFIEKREEWCISRQRSWGLPIPSIILNGKHKIIPEIIDHVADIVEKEGSDFWFDEEKVKRILKDKFNFVLQEGFEIGNETLDVWFDSGVSSFAVLNENDWPADLYLEGKDQFRGWFNSSLIISTILKDSPPYKRVLSHGFVVDKNGKKMSKSLGNTVDINLIIDKFGIDIARIWVSSFDFSKEIKISEEIFLNAKESYQKIRNTLRFLIGNLNSSYDFANEEKIIFSFDEYDRKFSNLNNYILSKIWKLFLQSKQDFFDCKFSSIYNYLNNFCVNDLSSFYFEIIKDSLYCDDINNKKRKEIILVIYTILKIMLKIISPITPFLSEELYKNVKFRILNDDFFEKESVHLAPFVFDFPFFKKNDLRRSELDFENYLLSLRKIVFQKIEIIRKEKKIDASSLKVKIIISEENQFNYLSKIENLKEIFIVSEIELQKGDNFSLVVEETENIKCKRCWRFEKESIGEYCKRCFNIIIK